MTISSPARVCMVVVVATTAASILSACDFGACIFFPGEVTIRLRSSQTDEAIAATPSFAFRTSSSLTPIQARCIDPIDAGIGCTAYLLESSGVPNDLVGESTLQISVAGFADETLIVDTGRSRGGCGNGSTHPVDTTVHLDPIP